MFQLFNFIFIIQQCFHGFLFEYFTASIKSYRVRVFDCQIVERFNFLHSCFKNLTTNVSVKKCTNLFSWISFQYTFFYRVTVKPLSKKKGDHNTSNYSVLLEAYRLRYISFVYYILRCSLEKHVLENFIITLFICMKLKLFSFFFVCCQIASH